MKKVDFNRGDRVLVSYQRGTQFSAKFITIDPDSVAPFIAVVEGCRPMGWTECFPIEPDTLDGIKIGHPMIVRDTDGNEFIKIYCGENKYGLALFSDNSNDRKCVYNSYWKLINYDYTQAPEVIHGKFSL